MASTDRAPASMKQSLVSSKYISHTQKNNETINTTRDHEYANPLFYQTEQKTDDQSSVNHNSSINRQNLIELSQEQFNRLMTGVKDSDAMNAPYSPPEVKMSYVNNEDHVFSESRNSRRGVMYDGFLSQGSRAASNIRIHPQVKNITLNSFQSQTAPRKKLKQKNQTQVMNSFATNKGYKGLAPITPQNERYCGTKQSDYSSVRNLKSPLSHIQMIQSVQSGRKMLRNPTFFGNAKVKKDKKLKINSLFGAQDTSSDDSNVDDIPVKDKKSQNRSQNIGSAMATKDDVLAQFLMDEEEQSEDSYAQEERKRLDDIAARSMLSHKSMQKERFKSKASHKMNKSQNSMTSNSIITTLPMLPVPQKSLQQYRNHQMPQSQADVLSNQARGDGFPVVQYQNLHTTISHYDDANMLQGGYMQGQRVPETAESYLPYPMTASESNMPHDQNGMQTNYIISNTGVTGDYDLRSQITASNITNQIQHQVVSQPFQVTTNNEEDLFDRPLDPEDSTIRDGESAQDNGVKLSIVTADSILNETPEGLKQANSMSPDDQVMPRMLWLTHLQTLFQYLESFKSSNKLKHVEKSNFMDALDKIKPKLPLQEPTRQSVEIEATISYKVVKAQFEEHLPQYFTWDNLFDILLYNSVASQFFYQGDEVCFGVNEDGVDYEAQDLETRTNGPLPDPALMGEIQSDQQVEERMKNVSSEKKIVRKRLLYEGEALKQPSVGDSSDYEVRGEESDGGQNVNIEDSMAMKDHLMDQQMNIQMTAPRNEDDEETLLQQTAQLGQYQSNQSSVVSQTDQNIYKTHQGQFSDPPKSMMLISGPRSNSQETSPGHSSGNIPLSVTQPQCSNHKQHSAVLRGQGAFMPPQVQQYKFSFAGNLPPAMSAGEMPKLRASSSDVFEDQIMSPHEPFTGTATGVQSSSGDQCDVQSDTYSATVVDDQSDKESSRQISIQQYAGQLNMRKQRSNNPAVTILREKSQQAINTGADRVGSLTPDYQASNKNAFSYQMVHENSQTDLTNAQKPPNRFPRDNQQPQLVELSKISRSSGREKNCLFTVKVSNTVTCKEQSTPQLGAGISLSNQSPSVRRTAAFNSIALRDKSLVGAQFSSQEDLENWIQSQRDTLVQLENDLKFRDYLQDSSLHLNEAQSNSLQEATEDMRVYREHLDSSSPIPPGNPFPTDSTDAHVNLHHPDPKQTIPFVTPQSRYTFEDESPRLQRSHKVVNMGHPLEPQITVQDQEESNGGQNERKKMPKSEVIKRSSENQRQAQTSQFIATRGSVSANPVDLDLSAKFKDSFSCLKAQVQHFKRQSQASSLGQPVDTNQIRSLSASSNTLIKIPDGFGPQTRNLLALNLSHNRLKSLQGLEGCPRLIFLNARHNIINSVGTLSQLTKLKELFLGFNQISNPGLREFSSLKQLQLLDLRKNKLSDEDKFIIALQGKLPNLRVLDLGQNTMQDRQNSKLATTRLSKAFSHVTHLNEPNPEKYSKFTSGQYAQIAFSTLGESTSLAKRAGQLTITELLPQVRNQVSRNKNQGRMTCTTTPRVGSRTALINQSANSRKQPRMQISNTVTSLQRAYNTNSQKLRSKKSLVMKKKSNTSSTNSRRSSLALNRNSSLNQIVLKEVIKGMGTTKDLSSFRSIEAFKMSTRTPKAQESSMFMHSSKAESKLSLVSMLSSSKDPPLRLEMYQNNNSML